MNTYENAPATALVATRCCACGRALLDAASVEIGMGPVCRERAGLDGAGTGADWERVTGLLRGTGIELETADARRVANRVVHRIAADQGAAIVPALVASLDALGFAAVTAAIREHLRPVGPRVEVAAEGDRFAVTFSGLDSDAFGALVAALRAVPGRRFDGARKVNTVPANARGALWQALRTALPAGTIVTGPRGVVALAA